MATYFQDRLLLFAVLTLVLNLTSCNEQKWDHFMFAQSWPPGTCADGDREHHVCHITPEVKTWTIHGLWPSLGESKGPVGCNNSWQFDYNKIKSLENELNTYWPNLYNDTTHSSFWAHEWDKHGTCCTDLDATAGEANYFTTGLKLNRQYDILQMLKASNIVPSETAFYSYDDFINAVKKVIGFEPVLQCSAEKEKNGTIYHLIGQVQICLNKDFSPRSCSNGTVYPTGYYSSKGSNSLLNFEKGEKNDLIGRRHSHHHSGEPQSSCSKKHQFHYPPIHSV